MCKALENRGWVYLWVSEHSTADTWLVHGRGSQTRVQWMNKREWHKAQLQPKCESGRGQIQHKTQPELLRSLNSGVGLLGGGVCFVIGDVHRQAGQVSPYGTRPALNSGTRL